MFQSNKSGWTRYFFLIFFPFAGTVKAHTAGEGRRERAYGSGVWVKQLIRMQSLKEEGEQNKGGE